MEKSNNNFYACFFGCTIFIAVVIWVSSGNFLFLAIIALLFVVFVIGSFQRDPKRKDIGTINNEIVSNPESTNTIDSINISQIKSDYQRFRRKINMEYLYFSSFDYLFDEAAFLIVYFHRGSTSLIQRYFKIGYTRSAQIMDQLEKAGIVGPAIGSKPREVLIKDEEELVKLFLSNVFNSLHDIRDDKLISNYGMQ